MFTRTANGVRSVVSGLAAAAVALVGISTAEAQITPSTFRDTIVIGDAVATYCVPTDELPGTPTTTTDLCADGTETYVEFELDEDAACLKYRALESGGADTSCVVVCDDLGNCDTTTVIVTTVEPDTYPDLEQEYVIFVGERGDAAIDVSAFVDPVAGLVNDCPDDSGTAVAFDLDGAARTLSFLGLVVGEERACVLVTDEAGRTQLTVVTVRVVPRDALVDTLRLRIGGEREWCFAGARLEGAVTSLADDCPAGDVVAGFEPLGEACANVTGSSVGTRDVCVVACDADGACDRIALHVEVLADDDPRLPIANDDEYVVREGETLTLEVLLNDENLGGVDGARLVDGPAFGFASAVDDPAGVEYTRERGGCDDDALTYEICNDFGCDRATVALLVRCPERPGIVVSTGFSPNGDDVNETFTIRNLEYYDGNDVQVYNRWGNRVFEADGYGNDWNGTFDGKDLPDGSYFYLVVVEGEKYAGSLQLRR